MSEQACYLLVTLIFPLSQVKRYLKLDYERSGTPKDDAFYDKIMEDIFKKNDLDVNGLITSKEYNVYQHDEL